MENNYDYWFSKYDSESFEKDFTKISFIDILNQLVSHPDFSSLPDKPLKSNQQGIALLQDSLIQFREITIDFFMSSRDIQKDYFYRWVRVVLAFMDCEKLYSIMFWNLNFIPSFIECRVYASLIRIYKFLISFMQNILSNKVENQHRNSNLAIKQRSSDLLFLPINLLLDYQKSILKVFKPLVGQNTTMVGKVYYFIYHMFDKSLTQLKKDLDLQFSIIEVNWVKRIINENQFAIKYLDAFIEEQEQTKPKHQYEDSVVLQQMSRDFYRVEPQEKAILEKSKKQQILEQIDKKARREIEKQSTFVQNFKEINSSVQSDGDFRRRKYKATTYVEDDMRTQVSTLSTYLESEMFRTSPNNPMNQGPRSVIQLKTCQESNELDINDDLLDYIMKADQSIVAIKDEDIIFDDANKKKRYRLKKRKNVDDNDSPELQRKQTNAALQQSQLDNNNEEEQRRLLARRLMDEQNQTYFEKLKLVNIVENETGAVKDIDLFRYSFEDSLEEDNEESNDELKNQKVPIPKNYSQNAQGIIFEKFRSITGDSRNMNNTRRINLIKKLFYFDQNSLSISLGSLLTDFEERKWDLLKEVIRSNQLSSKDKINTDIQSILNEENDSDIHYTKLRRIQKKNKNYQLF